MKFVDKALARRLESAEEMPQVLYAESYKQSRPEIGAEWREIAGGHMIFVGIGSPIGRATGLGLDREVTESDLNRIEEFYRSHGAPSQVDVCPYTDLKFLEMLKSRGYYFSEFNNVLVRKLDAQSEPVEEPQPLPSGVKIRRGQPGEAQLLSGILKSCFFPNGDSPEGMDEMLTPMFQFPGAVVFAGAANGKLVAAASGLMIPEHKVVALAGAGTLPEFRGQGLQTALLRHRMQAAAEAGCELAVIVTLGGTTSQRNAERLGFTVAYTKATLVRDLAKA
jgi:ribosomal protein S18 acetylase RimI-like enzyme